MARNVITQLVDDIDGSKADETVEFSIDNLKFEIDLSNLNAAALRVALQPYIEAGRRIPGSRTRSRGRRPTATGNGHNPAVHVVEADEGTVRRWAMAQGLPVPPRGRIPRDVMEQYRALNSGNNGGRAKPGRRAKVA